MAGTKKESGSVFEELRDDLFQEAAQLVSEIPSTKIAIFVTPPPGYESEITTCSFGHPSAEAVVKNFLEGKGKGKAPEEDEEVKDLSSPKGWWNDATLLESMNMDELKAVYAQLASLKNLLSLESEARLTAEGSSGNPEDQPNP